jgi:competence ComEA-like helix-hairpin-helix protein
MEDHRQNRIQSFAFLAVTLSALCISCLWVIHSSKLTYPGNVAQLDSLVNPNDATVASLIRLPGVGLAKALSIVTYRESIKDSHNEAFRNCQDLRKVKGIGPKTAADLGEFLRFE